MCSETTPGDTSTLQVNPSEHDGKQYQYEYLGCNACGRHLDRTHFFSCKTCTEKKIGCMVSFELCGPCIHKHAKGHVVLHYVDGKVYGQVDDSCVGMPPKVKHPEPGEPAVVLIRGAGQQMQLLKQAVARPTQSLQAQLQAPAAQVPVTPVIQGTPVVPVDMNAVQPGTPVLPVPRKIDAAPAPFMAPDSAAPKQTTVASTVAGWPIYQQKS